MDCRIFRESMDAQMSNETPNEFNQAFLRHKELCTTCREELTARNHLRSVLRQAVRETTVSPEFRAHLRQRLRTEVGLKSASSHSDKNSRPESIWMQFTKWFQFPQLAAVAAALMLLVATSIYFLSNNLSAQAATLHPTLLHQAAGDHDHCAAIWRNLTQGENDPIRKIDSFDTSLDDIGKYSAHQALGIQFHYAHVCAWGGRQFVHLVYSRNGELLSLLVTKRNSDAMKSGLVPTDDGLKAGLQEEIGVQGHYTISAYQTSKHVVLLVSTLDKKTQQIFAEQLAQPISNLLRQRGK